MKVHEGPINVHMHKGSRSTLTGSFSPNMFFSDEPGYYEDGNFGIRLETILRVTPATDGMENTYGNSKKCLLEWSPEASTLENPRPRPRISMIFEAEGS